MHGDAPEIHDPEIPLEREGQYTRLEELGRGGQSVVLRAFDRFVAREVALKQLALLGERSSAEHVTPELGDVVASDERRRFLREARLIARLDHPGIVSVHELARRPDGTIFSAQKLVRGETLKRRLDRCTKLSERLLLVPHLLAACQALAYAHSHQVIHRDLKPSNVMVGSFGETVVVDWGLAKLKTEKDEADPLRTETAGMGVTLAGTALGTPEYMSPEQARGDLDALDSRADVFGLGAILYEILTGRAPFDGATAEHVIENARIGRVHPVKALEPAAPPELAAIAERALSASRDERYSDGAEMAREVSAYLSGGWVRAYRYSAWELLRKFAVTHRPLLASVVLALTAMLAAGAVVVVRLRQTSIELASSFLERGYRSEQDGDWSKAAVYFAAARSQHDTREERWALASAEPRIAERILSISGPAETLLDVAVLSDGRPIALGRTSAGQVEVRDIESARTLWTSEGDAVIAAEFFAGDVVRLLRPGAWTFHEISTGRELQRWPRSSGVPCRGEFPVTVVTSQGDLFRISGPQRTLLATDAALDDFHCSVSIDQRRVAYVDRALYVRVVSLDGGAEIARRKTEPFRELRFSKHGLVIFRQGRLDIVAGPDGDFSIELPEATFGAWSTTLELGGTAVSGDGEIAAIAGREGLTQAILVDLQSRSIRGVVHYPSGWPRLAFSRDNQRVFAAGLRNGSRLLGWKVPPDDMPRNPRWWTFGTHSKSGDTALFSNFGSGRYELHRPPGTSVASGVRLFNGGSVRLVGEDKAGFKTRDSSSIGLVDLGSNRLLWEHRCRLCGSWSFSGDGARVIQVSADGLEVWDTRSGQLLFEERRRVEPSAATVLAWADGRRIAWTHGDRLVVRELESGKEQEFALDGKPMSLDATAKGERFLTTTATSLTLRDTATGRSLWTHPKELPDSIFDISWSPHERELVVTHGLSATEVLDATTGERIAWFPALRRVVTPVLAELYAPDMRTKGLAAEKTWDTVAIPQPDETPPRQALDRVLKRTGLQFRGVELVASP